MSDKITFSQLVEELAEQTESTQVLSRDFISELTDLVVNSAMDSGKAAITNFGSFSLVDVAERSGINPQTKEPIIIPAHQRLSFSPYKALEETVNIDYANLEATVIEEEIKKPVFKNPRKEKNTTTVPLMVIVAVLIFVLLISGLWFFVFKNDRSAEIAQENTPPIEAPVQTNPPAKESIPVNEETIEASTLQQVYKEPEIGNELPAETGLVASAPIGTSSHIVSKDEWFYDIARKTYDRATFWPLIFEANFSVSQDPDLLNPGKELRIPSVENAQNPTANDRSRVAAAAKLVSEAYTNAGKTEKATAYSRLAKQFSN